MIRNDLVNESWTNSTHYLIIVIIESWLLPASLIDSSSTEDQRSLQEPLDVVNLVADPFQALQLLGEADRALVHRDNRLSVLMERQGGRRCAWNLASPGELLRFARRPVMIVIRKKT